jgi:hypothetical protein
MRHEIARGEELRPLYQLARSVVPHLALRSLRRWRPSPGSTSTSMGWWNYFRLAAVLNTMNEHARRY